MGPQRSRSRLSHQQALVMSRSMELSPRRSASSSPPASATTATRLLSVVMTAIRKLIGGAGVGVDSVGRLPNAAARMAASETQIANRALQKLGQPSILALTANLSRAVEMNKAFASVRDAELNRRRWRFSFVRVSLPALASTPDSDYTYKYQLPGDFIRLVEGGDIRSCVDLTDYRGSP